LPDQIDTALINDWHTVAFAGEIVEGKLFATKLMGEPLVLWRSAGELHAWQDQCPHRGAPLSLGRLNAGRLICPYHGWEFDQTADCVHIPAAPDRPPPARAKVRRFTVKEGSGMVWVSLGQPLQDIPQFPEWSDATYHSYQLGPYEFANAFRAVENFLDAAHFPFVHPGIIGVAAEPEPMPDLEVSQGPEGLVSSEVTVFQPLGDPRRVPVNATYRYWVWRPTTASFTKGVRIADPAQAHRGKPDDCVTTYITVQPLDETTSRVRLVKAMNFAEQVSTEDVRQHADLLIEQDRRIVALQRPARLPLDLAEELHIRSDRLSVAYRRWLRALNVTYGTI
jgi:phenylpropionate dioxygenase-like ring-hydroxylating dioxygenase large terminal subunit